MLVASNAHLSDSVVANNEELSRLQSILIPVDYLVAP